MNTRAELVEYIASCAFDRRYGSYWAVATDGVKRAFRQDAERRLQDIEAAGCVVVPREPADGMENAEWWSEHPTIAVEIYQEAIRHTPFAPPGPATPPETTP